MRTDLHLAAASGDLAKVMQCVELQRLNINEQDKHYLTPLHVASRYGHAHIVAYLLQHGADRNARDAQGMVPEQHARSEQVRRAYMGGDIGSVGPDAYFAQQGGEDGSYVEL